MSEKRSDKTGQQGVSKVKLALGAASLFLFIIGLKRTFQVDEEQGRTVSAAPPRPEPQQQERVQRSQAT